MDITELQCPICFDVFEKPIMMCNVGHSLCNKCHEHCKECPNCQAPFSKARNFHLESILEKTLIKCEHEECPELLSGVKEFTKHMSQCGYVKTKCMVTDCTWKGLNIYVNAHLEEAHHDLIVEHGERINDLEEGIIKYDEFYFLITGYECDDKYCYICMHLTPMENNDFTFIYNIVLKKGTRESKIEQPCYLYSEEFDGDDVFDEQIMISHKMIDHYDISIYVEPLFPDPFAG